MRVTSSRSTRTTALVGAAVASAFLGVGGAAAAGSGPGAAPPPKPSLHERAVAPEGDPLEAAASAYRTVYPGMSHQQAERAASQQQARKTLQTELVSGDGGRTFAGGWFDPPTGVLHVAATTSRRPCPRPGGRAGAQDCGCRPTRPPARYAELRGGSRRRCGPGRASSRKAADGHVGIDVQTNRVVVRRAAAGRDSGAAPQPAGVAVVPRSSRGVVEDDRLHRPQRSATDHPCRLHAVALGRRQQRLLGRLHRSPTNNQRWVYTAGHCSNGNGVTWGTGYAADRPDVRLVNSAFSTRRSSR